MDKVLRDKIHEELNVILDRDLPPNQRVVLMVKTGDDVSSVKHLTVMDPTGWVRRTVSECARRVEP